VLTIVLRWRAADTQGDACQLNGNQNSLEPLLPLRLRPLLVLHHHQLLRQLLRLVRGRRQVLVQALWRGGGSCSVIDMHTRRGGLLRLPCSCLPGLHAPAMQPTHRHERTMTVSSAARLAIDACIIWFLNCTASVWFLRERDPLVGRLGRKAEAAWRVACSHAISPCALTTPHAPALALHASDLCPSITLSRALRSRDFSAHCCCSSEVGVSCESGGWFEFKTTPVCSSHDPGRHASRLHVTRSSTPPLLHAVPYTSRLASLQASRALLGAAAAACCSWCGAPGRRPAPAPPAVSPAFRWSRCEL
jgi:hypothetical protein